MRYLQLAILSTIGGFLTLGLSQGEPDKRSDDRKQVAAEQMRRIANAMKSCREEKSSETDSAIFHIGPPTNLEWNVVPSATPVRSPFQGIVTFSLPERIEESDKAKRSKKLHKEYMDTVLLVTTYGKVSHFEYDFDLGGDEPELVKMLNVDDKTKESRAVEADHRCWQDAARAQRGVAKP